MSFIRWNEQESDVYVYDTTKGYECCGCSINEGKSLQFQTKEELIKHLKFHKKQGDVVPDICFERLEEKVQE